jgi:hypothetical protein
MEQNTKNQKRSLVRTGRVAAVAALAAATLVACGQDGGSGAGGGTGDSGGELKVSVVEPAKDANVSVPFTLKVQSSVPLGTTASGKHHVHVWFDSNDADYMVVESDSVQVTNLSAGAHVLHVSLRNANHSAAGAETQSTVMVGGGGGPAATSSPTSDPYGY